MLSVHIQLTVIAVLIIFSLIIQTMINFRKPHTKVKKLLQ